MKRVFLNIGIGLVLTLLVIYNMAQSFVLVSLLMILSGDHHWSFLGTAVVTSGTVAALLIVALTVFWMRTAPILFYAVFKALDERPGCAS